MQTIFHPSESRGYANQGYYGEGVQWLGFPYLAELSQRAEYRMMTETRGRDRVKGALGHGEGEEAELERGGTSAGTLQRAAGWGKQRASPTSRARTTVGWTTGWTTPRRRPR